MKGHWSLSTKEMFFAQCSPRTAQAECGLGQFCMWCAYALPIVLVTASYDNLLMVRCMSDIGEKGERKQVRSWFRMGGLHVSLSTTGTGTIVHVSCSPPPPDSTQVDVSTMAILVGECTALWASQQHANLPAVVWRTGKGYSVVCVHDTAYM